MAFKKLIIPDTQLDYDYWKFHNFMIDYTDGADAKVKMTFLAYKSKEARDEGATHCDAKVQEIPFELFMQGFSQMTGFAPDDIAAAIYTLKEHFEFFKDAENV